MFFSKYTNIFNIIVCIILITKSHKTNGYPNDNEKMFPTNDVYGEIDKIKISLVKINSELDSLHNNLHLQTDLVSGIRNEIIYKRSDKDQCDTDESFNDIDSKLSKIKQNLHKVINENDDKHLDKMDSILQKVKSTKSCDDESKTEELIAIKTKISNKLEKLDHYAKRIEELHTKLEKPAEEKTSALETDKLSALDSIINEINSKLSAQEDKFSQYEEHLKEMKNISSTVEDYLNKKNKQRLRCSQGGRCMLYNLIGLDSSYNLTKVSTKENKLN